MRRGMIRVFFFCLLVIFAHSGIGPAFGEESEGAGDSVANVTDDSSGDTGDGSTDDSGTSDDTGSSDSGDGSTDDSGTSDDTGSSDSGDGSTDDSSTSDDTGDSDSGDGSTDDSGTSDDTGDSDSGDGSTDDSSTSDDTGDSDSGDGSTDDSGTGDDTGDSTNLTGETPDDTEVSLFDGEEVNLTEDSGVDSSDTSNPNESASGDGSGDTTNITEESGNETGTDSGDTADSGDTPNLTVTLSSLSEETGTVEITNESDDSGVIVLGEVVITASGTAIEEGKCIDGSGYCFTGDYGSGNITIYGGGEYYLTKDLTANSESFAIEITTSGVTLDGKGCTITGSGTGTGVMIDSGALGVTVKNFAGITKFGYGINSAGEDSNIVNNTVYGNDYGIYSTGDDAEILDNNANRNIYGIWSSGESANITNNTACFNNATGDGTVTGGYGIYSSGNDTIIQGNNASFNSVTALKSDVKDQDAEVNATGGYGIYSSGTNVTIRNNVASDNSASTSLYYHSASAISESLNGDAHSTGGYGIYSEGNNVTIRNNVASDNSASASLYYHSASASDHSVINSDAHSTGGYGIYSEGNNVTIRDNVASNNSASASLYYDEADVDVFSSVSTVNGNAHSTGGYGIYSEGNNVTIRDNVASENSASASLDNDYAEAVPYGIPDDSCSAVINGTASSTGGYGIYSEGNNVTIRNNVASENSASASQDNDYADIHVTANISAYPSATTDASGVINGNASSTGGYGIWSSGNNVTIRNNVASDNSASASQDNDYAYASATASTNADASAVINSDASSTGGYGISSSGNDVDIFNNTALNNTAFSSMNYYLTSTSGSGTAEMSGDATATGGYGISSSGDRTTISNNTADYNTVSATITVRFVIEGNAPITSTSFTGGFGLNATGSDATITGNHVSGNRYGIGISDSATGLNLTGNWINQSTRGGLNISYDGESGEGSIYNNYFGNGLNVCATALSASTYDWTNPNGPTLGTNIVGGPYLAGNYWSNATGDGWSDQQTPNETGYSLTEYGIVSGVNDTAPLIRVENTNAPTLTPTPIPTPTPASTSGRVLSGWEDKPDEYQENTTNILDNNPDEEANLSSLLPIHIILTGASFASPGTPGTAGTIALTLRNTGTTVLPPQARISLTPENVLAQAVGELNTTSRAGGEFVTSFPLKIPENPGQYLFVFQPEEVTTNVTSGEPVRITAGYLNRFIVTVPPSGDAGVVVS